MRFLAVRRGYVPPDRLRHIAKVHGYHNQVTEVRCKACDVATYTVYAPLADSPELSLSVDWLDSELKAHCGEHSDLIETPDFRIPVDAFSA